MINLVKPGKEPRTRFWGGRSRPFTSPPGIEICYIVVKVEFKELGTNYGWDDYTDKKAPWKSVESGNKTDTVKAEIDPSSVFSEVYFKSTITSKVTVSPVNASSAPQIVTVTGVAKGETNIQANIGAVDGCTSARIGGACYNKKTKTIAVTLVHEQASPPDDTGYTSTNISDAALKNMLKKVYKQSVQEFTFVRLSAKTIDFDDDHDGQMKAVGWMNSECAKIRDACKSSHDYNIFIVDNPSDGSLGWMKIGQKYGFVHADNAGGNAANVLCHELGHGQGLSHSSGADTDNLMHATAEGPWRLRKGQWDTLNP